MKKLAFILLFISLAASAICQDLDTLHVQSFKVRRPFLPLKAVYSYSNTLYTNVTNILQVNYTDTSYNSYYITTEIGYIQNLGHGRFILVKHNPGRITIAIYRKSPEGNSTLIAGQDFDVKPLPRASLTVGGVVIDSSVSVGDLLKYGEIDLTFGDFIPSSNWCYVDSFDVKIDSVVYHSRSNKLTPAMLTTIQQSSRPIFFENVIASINSNEDVKNNVNAKGERKIVQRSYSVEKSSKPLRLLR